MIHVRPARAADQEHLVRHSIGVAKETEGLEPPISDVRRSVAQCLPDPERARYFVAEEEGRVVGSLFVTREWSDWRAGWYWWIQGVYVEPQARGQGVFKAMYEAVRRAAAEAEVLRIRLYVERDNEAAKAAYGAVGMKAQPYVIYDAPV